MLVIVHTVAGMLATIGALDMDDLGILNRFGIVIEAMRTGITGAMDIHEATLETAMAHMDLTMVDTAVTPGAMVAITTDIGMDTEMASMMAPIQTMEITADHPTMAEDQSRDQTAFLTTQIQVADEMWLQATDCKAYQLLERRALQNTLHQMIKSDHLHSLLKIDLHLLNRFTNQTMPASRIVKMQMRRVLPQNMAKPIVHMLR